MSVITQEMRDAFERPIRASIEALMDKLEAQGGVAGGSTESPSGVYQSMWGELKAACVREIAATRSDIDSIKGVLMDVLPSGPYTYVGEHGRDLEVLLAKLDALETVMDMVFELESDCVG